MMEASEVTTAGFRGSSLGAGPAPADCSTAPTVPLVGLDAQRATLNSILVGVVDRKENSTILLTGPR